MTDCLQSLETALPPSSWEEIAAARQGQAGALRLPRERLDSLEQMARHVKGLGLALDLGIREGDHRSQLVRALDHGALTRQRQGFKRFIDELGHSADRFGQAAGTKTFRLRLMALDGQSLPLGELLRQGPVLVCLYGPGELALRHHEHDEWMGIPPQQPVWLRRSMASRTCLRGHSSLALLMNLEIPVGLN